MQPSDAVKKISKYEFELIHQVVLRAEAIAKKQGAHVDRLSLSMDLCCTHAAIPLQLDKLVSAPDFDFAHDVFGIQRHMNRTTGELEGCFLPRCAMHDVAHDPDD